MAGGWAMLLWNKWSIQILILLSFKLQVVIFLFAGRRRCNSRVWRLLLWLAYLLADTTALYTLGHISNSKLPELRPAAFWAQFLLLHLGGQDTMTAYAFEDNQLWLRHLLTLVLQGLGAAYMIDRHMADGGTLLVMAAILIYLIGFMKYGERVWTLKSSSHDGITNFLDNVKLDPFQYREGLFQYGGAFKNEDYVHDAEDVLWDAHYLLYISMGQFVDYKIWPSVYQGAVIRNYFPLGRGNTDPFEMTRMQLASMLEITGTQLARLLERTGMQLARGNADSFKLTGMQLACLLEMTGIQLGRGNADSFKLTGMELASLLEMTGMQLGRGNADPFEMTRMRLARGNADPFVLTGMHLSLMHDIFYTKTLVIHTWYGCCIRAISLVATVTSLLLFRFTTGKHGYTSADVAFTYTLLGGAIVLEITSILRAIGSSWTCAIIIGNNQSPGVSYRRQFAGLLSAVMFFRRLFKSARCGRRWSGSVGQHNLLDLFNIGKDLISRIARIAGLEKWVSKLRITGTVDISDQTIKLLMLDEIRRIVEVCNGNEDRMRSYRGQNSIGSLPDGRFEDLTGWCIDIDFDESVIAWHFATNLFLFLIMENRPAPRSGDDIKSHKRQDVIKGLSNYMMFLLVEHPYMLPSPVRARHYDLAYSWLLREARDVSFVSTRPRISHVKRILDRVLHGQHSSPAVLVRGATLATMLIFNNSRDDLESVILGVWVEMLCYAASHCSRDSHAKQLNSGAELITVVWILQTMVFNSIYADTDWFRMSTADFFQSRNQPAENTPLVPDVDVASDQTGCKLSPCGPANIMYEDGASSVEILVDGQGLDVPPAVQDSGAEIQEH